MITGCHVDACPWYIRIYLYLDCSPPTALYATEWCMELHALHLGPPWALFMANKQTRERYVDQWETTLLLALVNYSSHSWAELLSSIFPEVHCCAVLSFCFLDKAKRSLYIHIVHLGFCKLCILFSLKEFHFELEWTLINPTQFHMKTVWSLRLHSTFFLKKLFWFSLMHQSMQTILFFSGEFDWKFKFGVKCRTTRICFHYGHFTQL